ncbi:NAD(P)-binding protein [Violaceomyces palustris]|uniref:NAD(P)-binding protein n=1 Tax=Violaceomyces palustris TaxID=1673888 RepID=A0ACD0P7H9_9BASI|nr:NAD(P)-binding protein [Violaceomyces palustris]
MSSIPENQSRIVLRKRPTTGIVAGYESEDATFAKEVAKVPRSESELKEGDVLVKVEYVSLDPAMRGWLRDARSYLPPVQIGEVMRAGGVGTVVLSRFEGLSKGDKVSGITGWQEYATLPGKACEKRKIPPGCSLLDYLGPLGSSGQTAYWGIFDVGRIKSGDVVVVTGAAGSVGSMVVQLAKMKGCKVIAIAGSEEKCKWLKESLKADEALDYKAPDFFSTYREIATKKYGYIDVIFENVGGEVLDRSLLMLKPGARIAFCGAISDYNNPKPKGLTNYQAMIAMRVKLQGFIVFDYQKRYPEAEKEIAEWLRDGRLERKFHIAQGGLEGCPQALNDLFEGKNIGKMVAKVN